MLGIEPRSLQQQQLLLTAEPLLQLEAAGFLFVLFFETGFLYVALAVLELTL